jgi:hypothetical protein
MQIIFDESTLHQSKKGSITGVVYFDFGDILFPDDRWNDFVVVVVTWWLSALEKLERGIDREVVLQFMDGPYRITLTRQDATTVLLSCIEDRRNGGVLHEERVELPALTAQVRRLARKVASACSRNHLQSSDLDVLRRYLPN